MKRSTVLFVSLALAGCSSGAPQLAQGALAADEAARSFGVYAYLPTGNAVSLLAADGSMLANLSVTEPTADSRLVEITYTNGRVFSNEVTGPVDGEFHAPVGASRMMEDAVQLDPALAPLFAGHRIFFSALQGERQQLTPSTASCNSITFTSVCQKSNYCDLYLYANGASEAHAFAGCPRSSCPYETLITATWTAPGLDGVEKIQYCISGNSCSTYAAGYVDCMGCPYSGCQWEY